MLALVWIHLLAAVVWVGGMVFLSVVLVPVLKRDGAFAQHALLFRTVAYRFRAVVWGAMGMLVATGLTLAAGRSIPLTQPSHWPTIFCRQDRISDPPVRFDAATRSRCRAAGAAKSRNP